VDRRGHFELEFSVDGLSGVPVTIELTFRAGGKLTGVTALSQALPPPPDPALPAWRVRPPPDDRLETAFILRDGMAHYEYKGDTIEFGPGQYSRLPTRMEGNDYGWMNGHLRTDGVRVYLTGVTPFHHILILR
jgi:hypothetical protein